MVKKKVLENGIRILLEQLPYAKTASVGIWVKNGAVDEEKELAGISHFIEHMLSKGQKAGRRKTLPA
jgi:predicted Zn-dependent peptidase